MLSVVLIRKVFPTWATGASADLQDSKNNCVEVVLVTKGVPVVVDRLPMILRGSWPKTLVVVVVLTTKDPLHTTESPGISSCETLRASNKASCEAASTFAMGTLAAMLTTSQPFMASHPDGITSASLSRRSCADVEATVGKPTNCAAAPLATPSTSVSKIPMESGNISSAR